jgi:PKD repeat protein
MVRVVAVAALVVALLLSGCASDPKTSSTDDASDPGTSGTASADGGSSGTAASGSTGTGAAGNSSGALVATLAADALNGTAPLLVNFTVGATPASANATWTLSTNGTAFANGTGVPAVANHTFLAAGLWNVTLTVLDAGRNATAVVAINVTGDAGGVSTLLATYSNSGLVGGPYVVTNDPAYAHLCLGFNAGLDGYGCVFLELASVGAHDGSPGLVTTDAGNFRFAMYDECSGTGTATGFVQGASGATITIAAGTGCIVAWTSTVANWGSEKTFTLDVYDWLPEPEE